jgi:hypothetical protein
MKTPRLSLHFSVGRLLLATAVLTALIALITGLADFGRVYEERAILYIETPRILRDGNFFLSELTQQAYEEHAERLLSAPVLERAATLLNRRAKDPLFGFSPLAVRGIEPGERPVIHTAGLLRDRAR